MEEKHQLDEYESQDIKGVGVGWEGKGGGGVVIKKKDEEGITKKKVLKYLNMDIELRGNGLKVV